MATDDDDDDDDDDHDDDDDGDGDDDGDDVDGDGDDVFLDGAWAGRSVSQKASQQSTGITRVAPSNHLC